MNNSWIDDQMLLLNAAVDGELDSTGRTAVEAMMAADPELAAEYSKLLALQQAIRTRIPRGRAPDALRARASALANPPVSPTRMTPRRVRLFDQRFSALAATLLLGVTLGAGAYRLLSPSTNAADEDGAVLAGYIRGRLSGQPVDVATSDRHTVKPWLSGKVGNGTTVVDLKSDEFPLVGGRIDVVGTTALPTLIYQRREHQIALTEIPDSSEPTDPRLFSREGYTASEWRDGNRRYLAVSDLPPPEMNPFVLAFRLAADAESEVTPKP